ncbi:protein-disulfide isomerase [Mycobacterium sp. 852013-51886_SCH5428379]|uniref:DsbA family protein n=1 Tax=Mycobacterium sp. 852013-51886_SCH5428379 TaxID=1834111 RepID=UPI0008012FE3|nr:thioredoxin domain-containing protein [Mycobacterium sp. 852013-51886_SCH5428379]OBB60097.1 protein-disulfide isomerase [Mycobacterium sp. 852013-51886_SCH5428379]
MRIWIVLLAAVVLLIGGCTRQVTGTARPDPNQPGTSITQDGYGILIGDPNAPAQIEVFTEPQCPHCADLQADFGREIAGYVSLGQLGVTYRPVTFLDRFGDHSARVSNAMFVAAEAQPRGVSFQGFVEELWAHQQPGGSGPTDAELAEMARESGIPAAGIEAIAAGKRAVDPRKMNDLNIEYLSSLDYLTIGTPKVYDLNNDEVLDIYDDDWLAKLISTV